MYKNLNARFLGVSGFQSEIIELALSHSFGGIDLDVVDFSDRVQTKGLEYARRFIESAHIKIGCGQLPVAWHSDDETFQTAPRRLAHFLVAGPSCKRLDEAKP